MTVVKLAEVRPNADTIRLLEEALADAKAGKLQAFIITGDTPDHGIYSCSNFPDGIYLLGHLSFQMAALTTRMMQIPTGGDEP